MPTHAMTEPPLFPRTLAEALARSWGRTTAHVSTSLALGGSCTFRLPLGTSRQPISVHLPLQSSLLG